MCWKYITATVISSTADDNLLLLHGHCHDEVHRSGDTEEPCEAKVSSAQQSLWEVRFGSDGGVGDCPAGHNLGSQ